jgi:dipeptidyl aminopeptidase/acylaminoacyl peptidase
VLLVATSAAYLAVSAHLVLSLTHADRSWIDRAPDRYGLVYETVRFPSRVDGLQLEGWLITPRTRSSSVQPIILVHDRGADRVHGVHGQLPNIAADLAERGFPVLLFDLRGSGASQGAFVTLGAREVRDVGGAIDFLVERGLAPDGVNLLGFSMGAATALLAAPQEPLVRAVAADSAYVDLASVVQFHLAHREPWLRAFQPGVLLMSRVLLGITPERIRPIEAVPALAERRLPLLAIHGAADSVVPFEHARRLVAAYGSEAQTYFLDGSEHLRAYEHQPDIYTGRLAEFFSHEDVPLGAPATA